MTRTNNPAHVRDGTYPRKLEIGVLYGFRALMVLAVVNYHIWQQSWLSQFREYENVTTITRRLIVSLVERINLYENSEIEVVFRQRDQFSHIMEFLESQKEADAKKIQVFPKLEVV